MTQPMELFWAAMETATPVLRPEGWRRLPPELHDDLLGLEFVAKEGAAERVRCPVCPRAHYEHVMTRQTAAGVRHFIRCPVEMRVEVAPGSWQTWRINVVKVAKALRETMGLTGTMRKLVPDRLWSLGRTHWQDRSREVMLACGVGGADVDPVVQCIGGGHAIVLVPHCLPESRVWSGRVPAIVPLSQVVAISAAGLELDGMVMYQLVADADAVAESKSLMPVDPAKKKLIVRRQLKAELKSHLKDDALVAAYKRIPSYRKAAAELSRQMGTRITKEQVKNAVDRAGGIAAVMADEDTGSASRSVPSQRRDRGKKIDQYRK